MEPKRFRSRLSSCISLVLFIERTVLVDWEDRLIVGKGTVQSQFRPKMALCFDFHQQKEIYYVLTFISHVNDFHL